MSGPAPGTNAALAAAIEQLQDRPVDLRHMLPGRFRMEGGDIVHAVAEHVLEAWLLRETGGEEQVHRASRRRK